MKRQKAQLADSTTTKDSKQKNPDRGDLHSIQE